MIRKFHVKKSLLSFMILFFFHSSSAQFYFGRNKIQYNRFDWHVLQTEHFDIYYYPQMSELAEIGAAHAEKVYKLLESKFNHSLSNKIPLIFYATHAHFQETNTIPYLIPEGIGGFFEFLKGRVVVPANGSVSDFKRVLQHELVHVFTHSKVNRALKDHKLTNNPGLPLWYIEGLAEYWSDGWGSEAEMFLRDAVLNDYLVPLSDMYAISGTFLMYKEGQSLLRHIGETYGDNKLSELCDNVWMSKTFSEVVEATLGIDYKDLDKEWVYSLKKMYFPVLKDYDAVNMASDQMTEQGINIKPAFYKDDSGEKFIYISNRTGYSNICMQPLENIKEKPKSQVLVAGERTSAFESFHLLSSKMDVNDKNELVFSSRSGENDILYIYDLTKRTVKEHLMFDDLVSLYSPSWSTDGDKIVFSALAFSGKSDLYIYDRVNQNLLRLTDDYYNDLDPVWSPDGQFIAFSSDRGEYGREGFTNLFLYNVKTGVISYVTHNRHDDKMPAWSPDGQYLAFSSDRSGTPNIWILKTSDANGVDPTAGTPGTLETLPPFSAFSQDNPLKQITFYTTGAFDPEWTRNSDVLFTAFEKFSFQIYEIKNVIDTYKIVPVTREPEQLPRGESWAFEKLSGADTSKAAKYKPRYSLDIAQSQISLDPIFGTAGGMQLAISDMLGNYQYYFLLYNTARTKGEFLESFNFAVSKVDLSHRTNTAMGIYHLAGRFYNRYDLWFWERRYGGFGALSYPLTRFQRVEASLNVRFSDKEWFLRDYRRQALLVSNFASYIKDNSLWGPSGPIDGERINITLGNTIDVRHANVNFITVIFDYRRYFRLSNRMTHAVRLWAQINQGKEATPYFMGGSWDLRGYGFWRLWGTKVALLSNELRFPFIDRLILNFPFGGLGLSAIRGALFMDVGNAWDDELTFMRGSTGFGIRFRFGGVLVLRFDMGRKFRWEEPGNLYQFKGFNIDKKWFTQFFFGWDF
jgi:WD40 repeat protein